MMKERPILFSGPMVRAILDGHKTQTRRVVKLPHFDIKDSGYSYSLKGSGDGGIGPLSEMWRFCRHGQPGDRLWVRESGWISASKTAFVPAAENTPPPGGFRSPHGTAYKSCPSIHMPRWASRITLQITGVRVERLQDINEADAKVEGCAPAWLDEEDNETVHTGALPTYRRGYARLWREINGHDSWGINPWVWVIEFKRVGG